MAAFPPGKGGGEDVEEHAAGLAVLLLVLEQNLDDHTLDLRVVGAAVH